MKSCFLETQSNAQIAHINRNESNTNMAHNIGNIFQFLHWRWLLDCVRFSDFHRKIYITTFNNNRGTSKLRTELCFHSHFYYQWFGRAFLSRQFKLYEIKLYDLMIVGLWWYKATFEWGNVFIFLLFTLSIFFFQPVRGTCCRCFIVSEDSQLVGP